MEEKILNLRTANLCKLQIKKEQLLMIKNCSETSVTGNLPQLNDPTMISLGTLVMVMMLLQYSQGEMHSVNWKRESIVVSISIVTQRF
jgi:hypothetical protein